MSESHGSTPPPAPKSRLRRALPHLLWIALIAAVIGAQWRVLANVGADLVGIDAEPANIAWRTDWHAARAEAATTGKPILVDFTAEWCPPCQWMERDTWPDDRVEDALAAATIPFRADIDTVDGARLAQHYAVVGIPTLLLVDADGNVLRGGGFMDADGLLAFLQG